MTKGVFVGFTHRPNQPIHHRRSGVPPLPKQPKTATTPPIISTPATPSAQAGSEEYAPLSRESASPHRTVRLPEIHILGFSAPLYRTRPLLASLRTRSQYLISKNWASYCDATQNPVSLCTTFGGVRAGMGMGMGGGAMGGRRRNAGRRRRRNDGWCAWWSNTDAWWRRYGGGKSH